MLRELREMLGRHELSIDDKGRLVLPAAHRPRYENGAVLFARRDHIAVFDPESWRAFKEALKSLLGRDGLSRSDFNALMMDATDLRPDSAGRIVIPSWMRDIVGLGRDVIVGGVDDYLAIYPSQHISETSPEKREQRHALVDEFGI